MALDLSSRESVNKITLDALIADAVQNGNKEALEWLQKEATSKKERTKADGTKYLVNKSIVEIRPAYIKMFHNYKPQSSLSAEQAKARKQEKKQKELEDKFAKAFAQLGKKK